jgi:hypothetical protein
MASDYGRLVPTGPDNGAGLVHQNGGGGGGGGGGAAAALRACSSAHCSAADPLINEICKQLDWPVNHPVLTRDEEGPCICSCSCLAFGTMVQRGDGLYKAIETYELGDEVLAAGTSLQWSAKPVVFSQGTSGASRQKYTVLVLYASTAIAVTSDHLFLMRDRSLKRADRLAPGDVLVSPEGNPVPISSVHIGDYYAGFHHIATSKEPPHPDLEGDLINTNGVVSASYNVQVHARQHEVPGFTAEEGGPVVGSPEYVEQYGRASLEAPNFPGGFEETHVIRTAPFDTPDLEGNVFVPGAATIVDVPPDACRFLPDDLAAEKLAAPKRRFNDPLAREWTEYLIGLHRAFYPNVTYHLDWADNTVNAFAWVQNGVRHVALKGGLIRDADIQLEAIALVLAHELSHHYGGPPTFPGGLSCEGQADFNGVMVVMRAVWFGDQYLTVTEAAIQQMADFFGVPNNANAPGGSAGCVHPPGACRVATYHAAVNLGAKPGCAS